MSKIKLQEGLRGVSGRMSDWVYRQNADGTASIARRPPKRTGPPAGVQLETQNRFKLAAAFAREMMANPALREAYRRTALASGQRSAYLAAVTDYFNPPEILGLGLEDYHGAVGDKIRVRVDIREEVRSAHVVLKQADGTVLESGPAVFVDATWVYTATTNRPAGQPVTIVATAKDRPGNVGTLSLTLP
jgi:hypothetical protein